jgi:5-methylcytosine-specific restriction endonuclease McrA
MKRLPNTTVDGQPFSEKIIELVWLKGQDSISNQDFRKDLCGALIDREKYGLDSLYGWEIDHIKPVAKNRTDDLDNLQPLHWQNNRIKGDDWPDWECQRRS